jgi:hypothetical protein
LSHHFKLKIILQQVSLVFFVHIQHQGYKVKLDRPQWMAVGAAAASGLLWVQKTSQSVPKIILGQSAPQTGVADQSELACLNGAKVF